MKGVEKNTIYIFSVIIGISVLCYLVALGVLYFGPMIFGCTQGPTHYIGDEYVCSDNSKILVKQDIDNERFVYTHTNLEKSQINHYFDFTISYYNQNVYTVSTQNSEEFTYVDSDGNKIEFNEQGAFFYSENKTIYISYKNASDEIKTAILNGKFSLNCANMAFHSHE